MTVYLESLIGVNFLADFALLWLTGRCCGVPCRLRRLAAAALAGAGYALLFILVPGGPAFGLPGKLATAAFMLRLAFRPRGARQWMGLSAVFAGASTAMAGVALAVNLPHGALAAGQAIVLPARTPGSLPLAFAAAAASAYGLAAGVRRLERLHGLRVPSQVTVGTLAASFVALVDTGNELRDPISGRPVMIVESDAVRAVIPQCYQAAMCAEGHGLGQVPAGIAAGADGDEDGWAGRLRFIPYRTVGRRQAGLLLGFRPDAVHLALPGRGQVAVDMVVAVSPRPLSGHGAYQAILPSSVASACNSTREPGAATAATAVS